LAFFVLFSAHTPDNTFLGFIVETYDDDSPENKTLSKDLDSKKDWALVYGKENYMWRVKITFFQILSSEFRMGLFQNITPYIEEISKILEVHATVGDAGPEVPSFVVNHGLLSGPDLHKLLQKVKVKIF